VIDEDFFQNPVIEDEEGIEIGEGGEVVQMQANYQEGLQEKIDIGELDPRKEEDKPLIEISKELNFLNLDGNYISQFLLKLRSKQREKRPLYILPFLNAKYVANAHLYLDTAKGEWSSKTMQKYIKEKNEWYKTTREGRVDSYPYLNATDFFRYVLIDEKYLN